MTTVLKHDDWVDEATGRWVLVATVLASSMAFLMGSALNVALPAIQRALEATGAQLLWIRNGYTLVLAALILVGGALGDKFGRKRIYAIGIVLFTVTSIGCALAPTADVLIGMRFVQGVGGALMIPGSLAIITASFSPQRRGMAIGTWSAWTTIVNVAGPVLGGVLAESGLWRGIFMINVPLAIGCLFVLIQQVPESFDRNAPDRIDYPGAVLATLGLAGVTYGVISAPERGFSDPFVAGGLILGVVFLIAFVIVEARSDHPMLPLRLFQSKTFSGANLLTLFLYGALGMYSFFLSLNLVQVQGYRETIAGFAFMPFALGLVLLSRWAGGLVDRIGPRLPLIVGPLIAAVGFFTTGLIGLTDGPSDYWTTFLPTIVIFAVGMGVTVAPLTTTVMSSVATHYAGTASGVNNAVSRTADALAVAILGAVALFAFQTALVNRTADIDLTEEARTVLIEQESRNLGDAQVPDGVSSALTDEVDQAIKLAFVDVFRIVMWICAGMAVVSAGMTALLVEPKLVTPDD